MPLRLQLSRRAPSGTITTIGRSGARRIDHHRQPLDPCRPADRGRVRAAQSFDQSVIAAAGDHGALRAEPIGDELEGGVAIIIEAADQPRRALPGDPGGIDPFRHRSKKSAASRRQDIRR